VHFAPTESRAISESDLPLPWLFQSEHHLAENFENFIRGKTGFGVSLAAAHSALRSTHPLFTQFAIKRSPWPLIMVLLSLTTTAVLALRFAFKPLLELAIVIRDAKPLWIVLCIGVFFIAVSGVLFDIIRSVPWISVDPQTRKPVVVIAQNGTQTVLEGLLVGALNIAAAVVIIALTHWSRYVKTSSTKSYGAMILMGVFFFAYTTIVSLYRYKNRWYMQY